MKTEPTVPPCYHWIGKSGEVYPYVVFKFGEQIWRLPGNFIVCDQISPIQLAPIEIDETDDLEFCLIELEQYYKEHGRPAPDYVHVRINIDDEARAAEAQDLKDLYMPDGHPVLSI